MPLALRNTGSIEDNGFSPFPLTAHVQPTDVAYDGVVLDFAVMPEKDLLSGFLQYESVIADEALAIKSSWIAALTE